jgi:hypothetical protein
MPVIIDLMHVTSLTSAGVQALLRERSFGQPALVCPQGTIASTVLEIVHADLLVLIYPDLDAAIGAA